MKNGAVIFISDVHLRFSLTGEENRKRDLLGQFLEWSAAHASTLVIVGDFFDFWFEWSHVVPKHWWKIIFQLQNLIKQGIDVHILAGNHDFYLGDFLRQEVGLNCHPDSWEFVTGNRCFFIAHGDGLAKKDRGYRILKRVIRHPLSIKLFRSFVPANFGMRLAKMAADFSRGKKPIDKKAWTEEYFRFAQKKFAEGFDIVVMGHIHYPIVREWNGKIYVNCGDWIEHFSYVQYQDQQLTLNYWKDSL